MFKIGQHLTRKKKTRVRYKDYAIPSSVEIFLPGMTIELVIHLKVVWPGTRQSLMSGWDYLSSVLLDGFFLHREQLLLNFALMGLDLFRYACPFSIDSYLFIYLFVSFLHNFKEYDGKVSW